MRYRKINDDTVQCIITVEDMDAYGLTIKDIFERNEKGEGFLRDVIQGAQDEVGYVVNSNNIAMQITPMNDNGLVITFSDEGPGGFQNILEHLKQVLAGTGLEYKQAMNELHQLAGQNVTEDTAEELPTSDMHAKMFNRQASEENIRVLQFDSLETLFSFCMQTVGFARVRSQLYLMDGQYYLVLDKYRLSWKNYNRVCAMAMEFGRIIGAGEQFLLKLDEHGELLIDVQAIGKIKKICS